MAAALLAIGLLVALPAWATQGAKPAKTMKAFASEREFAALLHRWKAKAERERRSVAKMELAKPVPAPAPAAASATSLESVSVAGTALLSPGTLASDDITNVQTTGVDEGDIVKKHGDFLVVLRRGRLFTLRIGGDALQAASTVNAYPPDADPSGTWYDEMLVNDHTVVVIGYSYARGGTEIGLFDLDAQGVLRYRDTYQLRSNDYYSARNYASRLIGDRLVFYTPLDLSPYRLFSAGDPAALLPALRHWHHDAIPRDFKRILPATRIHRTDSELDPDRGIVLHTVTTCELAAPMRCESTAVLGPDGHVFYVSEDAVYVWTTQWSRDGDKVESSSVFRMPLDGAAPSALKTSGSPIDQMSFLQRDGWLNVLVGSDSDGEGMWSSASRAGDLALLRVRIADFADGSTSARANDYRVLPRIDDEHYDMQNRFVGDWLLYGSGSARNGQASVAYALRYGAAKDQPQALALRHEVERIDALGRDALLVGGHAGDLHFTSVRLGRRAQPVSVHVERDAAQGDTRTHGFFYKPETDDMGIAGLPVIGSHGDEESAGVLYLRNRALRLSRLGTLDAHRHPRTEDGCQASCVDWYGNARPIFVGTRVFALLGYELVEGRVDDARGIRERRRIDFTPAAPVSR
jgi:hypothetical protein